MAGECKKAEKRSCAGYGSSGRRDINKVWKLSRHLARHPSDDLARKRLADIHLTYIGVAKREMKAAEAYRALAVLLA